MNQIKQLNGGTIMFKLLNKNGEYTLFAIALIWILKGKTESEVAKHTAYGRTFKYLIPCLRAEETEFLFRIIESETEKEFYNLLWELFEVLNHKESLCFVGLLMEKGFLRSETTRNKALSFIS